MPIAQWLVANNKIASKVCIHSIWIKFLKNQLNSNYKQCHWIFSFKWNLISRNQSIFSIMWLSLIVCNNLKPKWKYFINILYFIKNLMGLLKWRCDVFNNTIEEYFCLKIQIEGVKKGFLFICTHCSFCKVCFIFIDSCYALDLFLLSFLSSNCKPKIWVTTITLISWI